MRFARDAYPLAGGFAVAAALVALWSPWASLVPLTGCAFSLFFFRDPSRTPPADRDVVLSPADGRVIVAQAGRVSVFLSVFNVHICRAPVSGRVESIRHRPGRFLAAYRAEASEQNERAVIEIVGPAHRLTFTMVAGLIARRIVCFIREGTDVAAGERIGLIRFGSRVDIDLPKDAVLAVQPGDRVRAGETILGRLAPNRTG